MTLTTLYLTQARQAMKDDCNTNWTYGGVGTGTTPATPADTDIETPIIIPPVGTDVRKARQQHTQGTAYAVDSLWLSSTEANGNTLTEVGFFDSLAPASGNMWNRNVYTGIGKTNDIEIWYDVRKDYTVTEV